MCSIIEIQVINSKILDTLNVESCSKSSYWLCFNLTYFLLSFEEITICIFTATKQFFLAHLSQSLIFQFLLCNSLVLILHERGLPSCLFVSYKSIFRCTYFWKVFNYSFDLLLWQVAEDGCMLLLQHFLGQFLICLANWMFQNLMLLWQILLWPRDTIFH